MASSCQAAVWLKDTASLVDGQVVRTGKQSDFWTHADWFASRQVRDEPIDGGLLDLSRYLND